MSDHAAAMLKKLDRDLGELEGELTGALKTVVDMRECLQQGRPIGHSYVRPQVERIGRAYTEYAHGLGVYRAITDFEG